MGGRDIKVLVADPSRLVAEALRDMFLEVDSSASVLTAHTPQEAVEIAVRERPDLIVIDAWMAHGDSLEVVRRLVETVPASELVVMATKVDEVLTSRMRTLGAATCIEKDRLPACAGFLVEQLASR